MDKLTALIKKWVYVKYVFVERAKEKSVDFFAEEKKCDQEELGQSVDLVVLLERAVDFGMAYLQAKDKAREVIRERSKVA